MGSQSPSLPPRSQAKKPYPPPPLNRIRPTIINHSRMHNQLSIASG